MHTYIHTYTYIHTATALISALEIYVSRINEMHGARQQIGLLVAKGTYIHMHKWDIHEPTHTYIHT